jgi:hypothetical protein
MRGRCRHSRTLRRSLMLAVGAVVAAMVALVMGAAVAEGAGGKPVIERGSFVESFADDFIFELCGIETTTTLTQRFVVTTFPDGSQQIHVTRTFVSDDPRLPIEKGAGSAFIDANGVRTVVGTPIHLIGPDGGTRLIDAGLVTFGNELDVRGPHPSLFVPDLAPYYCP